MEYPESGTVDAQSHLKENTLLRFRVGPFRFSVPAVEVEGIIIPPHLTVIPLNPPHSKGVFMFHQRLASAISLRTKFGLPDNDDENLGQLVTNGYYRVQTRLRLLKNHRDSISPNISDVSF